MKLSNVLKKTLLASMTVLLAAALTFTGCSNGSSSSDDDDDTGTTGGATGGANGTGGTSTEVILKDGELTWDGLEITKYTKYAKAGAKIHLDVENKDDYCKVLILDKDWGDSGVTEAFNENEKKNVIKFELKDDQGNDCHRPCMEGEGKYYFVLNAAALEKPTLSLFGNAKVNKITIEYVGGKKKADNDNSGNGDNPAFNLDFTTVGSSTITEKFSFVDWDSVSRENKGSITSDGLVLNVNESWDGAFKAATNSIDLSAVTKITVEYKVSADWAYADNNNNKCNIMLVSEENASYTAVKVDLGDFAQAANNTSFAKEEITNIYPKTWDNCSGADKSSIIAININTQSGVGTITIKSIKFYN